jgi:hypothetical protein
MNTIRQPGRQRLVRTTCPLATARLARRADGIADTLHANAATGSRAGDDAGDHAVDHTVDHAGGRTTTAWRMRGGRHAASVAAPYHPPRRRSMPAPRRHP